MTAQLRDPQSVPHHPSRVPQMLGKVYSSPPRYRSNRDRRPPQADTILLGDFNQSVPRTKAPLAQQEALLGLLAPHLNLATRDTIPGLTYPAIDHLAHSSDLAAVSVAALSNRPGDGARLSDHVGLVITLRRLQAA